MDTGRSGVKVAKDKTNWERKQRFEANNKAKGLVMVKTWVPSQDREAFIALAAELRAKHSRQS